VGARNKKILGKRDPRKGLLLREIPKKKEKARMERKPRGRFEEGAS